MATKAARQFIKAERNALITEGVVAILFGLTAVFWPGLTAKVLVYLFASFMVADALVVLITGLLRLGDMGKAALFILLGLVELGFGLYLFHHPLLAFGTLVLVLGLALIVRGAFSFAHAFTAKGLATTRFLHVLLGILGIVIGIIVLGEPVASGVAFVWILGLYALIAGPAFIGMAAELNTFGKKR